MDFSFTEEHEMIRKTARDFANDVLKKGVKERDEKGEFPRELIRQMGELGFMGIMVPEEYGGAGMDGISYCILMEEIAKVDASAAVIISVNNSLVCQIFQNFGSEEQKEKYLKPLAAGEKLGCFSLSEPQSGSDASNMRTLAVRDGDHYVINGTKNWVTNGFNSDLAIVFVITDKEKKHKGISALIVEKGTPGFSVGKKENKLGIRGSDTTELIFEDCRVPVENRIGEEGEGFKIAMWTLDGGRIGIAAQALGIAQGALERALQYSKERKQFGKPICEFQGVAFKLADMATAIGASRLLIHHAAWLKDQGMAYSVQSAMAKLMAAETAMKVSTEAVQIFGGYGYMKEYEIERYMRDAKITEIYEGTSEVQRIVISRDLIRS